MSERIRKLAEQANIICRDSNPGELIPRRDLGFEKIFAELIVRECAEVAHCNFHVDGVTLGNILKEHFGVKE
jgi:hypothetical protein